MALSVGKRSKGKPAFPPPNVTHVWPKDDSFDLGGLSMPAYYSSWISCHAFPVAVAFGSGVVPQATIVTHEPKSLTDAYSPSSGSRLASIAIGDHSADGGDYSLFLRRDVISNNDDFMTETSVQVLDYLNALGSNNVPQVFFVAARVSGMDPAGPAVQSWGNEYYLGVGATPLTGYFFGSASSVGNESRFFLVKIVAGVITNLAEAYFNPGGATHLYSDVFGDKTLPHYYRMQFAPDGGGGIDITCTVGASSMVVGGATTETIFTVNDSSPITTAGRSGFLAQSEADASTLKYVVAIPYSRIDVAGVTVCNDRWLRRQPGDARAAQAASHTVATGRDLRSGWTGDALGLQTVFNPWLRDGTLHSFANRTAQYPPDVALGSSTDTWKEGYSLSQRESTASNTHHRSIRARFSSSGTAPTGTERRWAGVLVRCGTGASAGSVPRGGYLFQVSTDDGGTFANPRLELWRIDETGTSALLIAEDTVTPISVDTDYTVQLQAFNIADAGGNPDGIVVLKAFLNGSQVAFSLSAAAISAGLEDGGSGTLLDNTSGAIRISTGEGFRIGNFTGTRFVYVDEWTEQTLEGEIGTDENDQATIAVNSETYNDSGQTLTLPTTWLVEEVIETEAEEFEFETGYVRRSPSYSDTRRRWIVRAVTSTTAERDNLLQFWDDHEGIEKSFSWIPPHQSASVSAHFAEDELEEVLRAPGIRSFTFEIEELL